ncbi:MAG: signal peptide peptidase SppA [Myxococcota bacterium]
MVRSFALLIPMLALLWVSPGRAQWRRASGGTVAPVPIAGGAGALGLDVNPAALARVSGWEAALVYAGAEGHGLGLYGVRDLPFGLSVAGALDWRLRDGEDDGRVSVGGAWARSSQFAFGAALRYADGAVGRRGALDVGTLFSPHSRLSFSVVVHDLLGPLGLSRGAGAVPATLVGAAQLRPFETDALVAEVAAAVDTDGDVGLRGFVGVAVPRFGQLQIAVDASDVGGGSSEVRVFGNVVAHWGRTSAGGGAMGRLDGNGDDRLGALAYGAVRSHERDGLPLRGYVDDVEVRGGLGSRGLLALLARLDRDRYEPDVAGVLLRLRGSSIGHGAAQEIREAIASLRAAGRPVLCQLAAPSGPEIYACAAANETLLDPAGTAAFIGTSTTVLHYGEALRRLGVRTDFVRVGQYKGAVEVYGRGSSTAPVRIARRALLDDVYARLADDLADDWSITRAEVRHRFDEGPYAAEQAATAGIVDGLADEYALGADLRRVFGTSNRRRRPLDYVPTTLGRPSRVAVLTLDGSLVNGDNVDYPIVEIHQTGARTFIQHLEAARRDRSIRAVLLRIDSPGGSALAADQIWRAVRRVREVKPVVASLGPLATSAAYYVASAADVIYAEPSTVTGSIGVLFGKVDFAPLAETLGVGIEQEARGAHAGAESLYRAFTDEERALLQEQIEIYYALFLERVAEGRGMEPGAVHDVAQGRIWSGDAALGLGLVDRLGGFVVAMEETRRRGGLGHDAPFTVTPFRPASLLDYVAPGLSGALGEGSSPASLGMAVGARRIALDLGAALARSEGAPLAIVAPDALIQP